MKTEKSSALFHYWENNNNLPDNFSQNNTKSSFLIVVIYVRKLVFKHEGTWIREAAAGICRLKCFCLCFCCTFRAKPEPRIPWGTEEISRINQSVNYINTISNVRFVVNSATMEFGAKILMNLGPFIDSCIIFEISNYLYLRWNICSISYSLAFAHLRIARTTAA